MTTPTPPQDKIERLSVRVLAAGRALAASGDGRTFTNDDIFAEFPDVSRQRLNDAIKTLKDNRSIRAIGKSRGIYEIEQGYPPSRAISVTVTQDGWRLLEVGDAMAIALTPREFALLGEMAAGAAVQIVTGERFQGVHDALWERQLEAAELKVEMKRMRASLRTRRMGGAGAGGQGNHPHSG
jgi:hypothetical protein